MRRVKGCDRHIRQLHPRFRHMSFRIRQSPFQCLQGPLGGNDGQMIFFGKHPHAIDVIRMLVSEQNSLNRQRVNPADAQHVVQLPRTAAGVEQQTCAS